MHCLTPLCICWALASVLSVFVVVMHNCSRCGSSFSSEDKRDEHQWLCIWRSTTTSLFFCHCCTRKFTVEDQRNDHEYLCRLKMPPGSCFTCTFCNVRMSMYSHAAFVHHEKHCALNPVVAKASEVMRKYSSRNGVSLVRDGSNKKCKSDLVPICACPVDRDRCVTSTSYSNGAAGQKYFFTSVIAATN